MGMYETGENMQKSAFFEQLGFMDRSIARDGCVVRCDLPVGCRPWILVA